MKTLEQVKHHLAYTSGYISWVDLMDKIDDNEVLEHYIDCVAIMYAEQAIDECANKATASIVYEDPYDYSCGVKGAEVDDWSILDVKEELK